MNATANAVAPHVSNAVAPHVSADTTTAYMITTVAAAVEPALALHGSANDDNAADTEIDVEDNVDASVHTLPAHAMPRTPSAHALLRTPSSSTMSPTNCA